MPSEVSGFRRPLNQKNRGTDLTMWRYIFHRMLLLIPTLLGILAITFAVIQFVPGGPVEQMVQQLTQGAVGGEQQDTACLELSAKNGEPHQCRRFGRAECFIRFRQAACDAFCGYGMEIRPFRFG